MIIGEMAGDPLPDEVSSCAHSSRSGNYDSREDTGGRACRNGSNDRFHCRFQSSRISIRLGYRACFADNQDVRVIQATGAGNGADDRLRDSRTRHQG
jgi:hypothetical protein